MDTRVVVFLLALFAVAVAEDPDDDLTQIFQSGQEEGDDVHSNSVQQGDTSDLTQIFQSGQDEDQELEQDQDVQPNSAEQEASNDLTQIFESEQQEVQQNSEQESEVETGTPQQCGVTKVQGCLAYIAAFVATEEDDNNEACEAVRLTYNCLKNMADNCLQGEERESVEPRLNQIKSAMDANCDFGNEKSEEHKCIDSMKNDIEECLYEGIIKTWANFKKTGENDKERFKCMAYNAIADCQTDKILAKCGDVAAEQFHDYMADLPEEIREACEVADVQHEDIYEVQLLQRLTRRKK